jgi:hypothetical protein
MSSWTIVFNGNSGAGYKYWSLAPHEVANLLDVGGNYGFLKPTGNSHWSPLYFGQADNLRNRLRNHDRWAEAVRLGATVIVTHTTPAGELARLAEERDLIAKWNPPLNVHHRTTG